MAMLLLLLVWVMFVCLPHWPCAATVQGGQHCGRPDRRHRRQQTICQVPLRVQQGNMVQLRRLAARSCSPGTAPSVHGTNRLPVSCGGETVAVAAHCTWCVALYVGAVLCRSTCAVWRRWLRLVHDQTASPSAVSSSSTWMGCWSASGR
jgi:hypothetical protein